MKPEFDITITSRNAEEQNDALAKQEKLNSLLSIKNDPILAPQVNAKKMIESLLKVGNFDDEEISQFLETTACSNRDIIAAAAQAAEEIMAGKEPRIPINEEANLAFLLKIHSFIKKLQSSKLEPEKLMKLNNYWNAHIPVVLRNQQQEQMLKSMLQQGAQPMAGAMLQGQQVSNELPSSSPLENIGSPPNSFSPPQVPRLNIPNFTPG